MKQLLNTCKQLLIAPRTVIDPFINGERESYIHPFKLCIYGVLITVLLFSLFVNFSLESTELQVETDEEELREMMEWIQIATIRMSTHFLPLMMVFLFIPMLSLGGLFFQRKNMEGFYSHLVLNSYAVGVSLLPLLFLIPVWIFSGISLADPLVNTTIPAVIYSVVILLIYQKYFDSNDLMSWIRMISSYITGFILFVFLNSFAGGVIGYVIFVIKRIIELSGA